MEYGMAWHRGWVRPRQLVDWTSFPKTPALLRPSSPRAHRRCWTIFSALQEHPEADFAKGESELKIQFHQDLADTLGGEVTFALDGPILPTPSWKMIVEVYNPGRLQATIQQLVNDANEQAKDDQHKIALDQETVNGLTYYTLHASGRNRPVDINYTFTDGYMVVGSSRALVMNALSIHQSGNSLARSSDFRSLLPQDQHTDVSALFYQNLAPVVGPVMSQLSPSQL